MTQKVALEILKQGKNVYLTGPAGTGKTYLLNKFIDYCKKNEKQVAITASTGIAATHMNGMTIHSWCGMGIKQKLTKRDIDNLKKDFSLLRRLVKADVLIIDEVSMLHDYQLDIVDKICRAFKDPFKPMGGLQVILCGDFFQLPPVSKGIEKGKFILYSEAWQTLDPIICYLHEIHRQEDNKLSQILQAIRARDIMAHDVLKMLLSRENKEIKGCKNPPKLYTHNKDAEEYNKSELDKIEDPPIQYKMTSEGKDHFVKQLKKDCLAPETLILKKGAAVMFVKNNFEEGYVNGTTGEVVDFCKDTMPIVKLRSGKKIIATPQTWLMEEDGDDEPLASIRQLPLRLAWAITIHKSQGMTLDAVEINLGKAFEYGQGYVALSRAKSLDSICLMGLNRTALEVNPLICKVDKLLQELSISAEKNLLQDMNYKLQDDDLDQEQTIAVEETVSESQECEYIYEDNEIADVYEMEENDFKNGTDTIIDINDPTLTEYNKVKEFLKKLKAQNRKPSFFERGMKSFLKRMKNKQ